jgi:hypothetical protein
MTIAVHAISNALFLLRDTGIERESPSDSIAAIVIGKETSAATNAPATNDREGSA